MPQVNIRLNEEQGKILQEIYKTDTFGAAVKAAVLEQIKNKERMASEEQVFAENLGKWVLKMMKGNSASSDDEEMLKELRKYGAYNSKNLLSEICEMSVRGQPAWSEVIQHVMVHFKMEVKARLGKLPSSSEEMIKLSQILTFHVDKEEFDEIHAHIVKPAVASYITNQMNDQMKRLTDMEAKNDM